MTWHMFYSHRWVQFGGTGVSEMMWKLCRQTKKPKAFRFLDAKCWIWAVFSWNRKSNQDVSKHFFQSYSYDWLVSRNELDNKMLCSWSTSNSEFPKKISTTDARDLHAYPELPGPIVYGIRMYLSLGCISYFFRLGAWPKSFQQTKWVNSHSLETIVYSNFDDPETLLV